MSETDVPNAVVEVVYNGMHLATCRDHGPHCYVYISRVHDALRIGIGHAIDLGLLVIAETRGEQA